MYRSGFVKLGADAPPPVPPNENKYKSIHTLKDAEKIKALKDTKLNPLLIEDGYDAVAHAMHLWTQMGAKAKAAGNISFDEQKVIADKFYDRVLAPAYGHLAKDRGGIQPISRELWQKQAYSEALDYKIEDAYTNNWTHSLKNGWNSGLAATAHVADKISTMTQNVFTDAVGQWRKEAAFRELPDEERAKILHGQNPPDWTARMQDIQHQVDADKKYDENIITRGARWQNDHRDFWAAALPTHEGVLNKATSFVAEQVGQAPIFASMELGTAPLAWAGKATTLTEKLNATPAGRRIAGYLTAGAEGLAYGMAVRKQEDPGEAWRDMVGFAVFHGVFDVGGLGLKKLTDVAPEAWKPKLEKRAQVLDLAQEGNRPATAVEVYNDHKVETSNNLMAVGVSGQRAIHVDALHHVHEMENVPRAESRKIEAQLLKDDPSRWAPVLSAARFVRKLIGEKKLSEIEPGSEEEKFLSSRLGQLVVDSASEMNTNVHGMGEASEAKAIENLKQPSAKNTLQYYINQEQARLASTPGAAGMVTPEMVQKAAIKAYAKDVQAAAETAEKETNADPVTKATNIAERSKPPKAARTMKVRTKFSTDKYGQPSASYSVVPEYKVALKAYAKAAKAKGQSLREFFTDMSDEDFEQDLSKHFYPKSLRKAEIFFEHQNTREGMQNPNFLGFMYNHISKMPREFGEELEQRFLSTVKAQAYMKGRQPTEPQLLYYAKAMHNHVDNFLGSGRWPEEHNIFRSSNEDFFNTTQWQHQLLIEKTLQEQSNLKEMFSGDKKATSLALKTHAAFAKLRMNEFTQASPKRNSQELIKGYDDIIADLQTHNGEYERWDF